MTTYKTKKLIMPIILCVLFCVLFMFAAVPGQSVRADEAEQNILDDFVDTDLDISEYPEDPDNNSLSVIQLAETVTKELVVYVYVPKKSQVATSINISKTIGDELAPQNYKLKLMEKSGAIHKYKVTDFVMSLASERTYFVVSIYRAWNDEIDGELTNGNTVSEKAFAVGKLWTAYTVDGDIKYTCKYEEVISITGYYHSSVRYMNKSLFYAEACDCFFVAFSTDRRIEKLLEADVDFEMYSYTCHVDDRGKVMDTPFIFPVDGAETAHLTATGVTDVTLNGFKDSYYTWKWIQSTEDFLKGENLSEEIVAEIKKQQWVLRYFASDLDLFPVSGGLGGVNAKYRARGYGPENVSILRLKFETDGVVYDLGAVSDKATGDFPDNNERDDEDFWAWFKKLIKRIFSFLADNWHWIVIGVIGVILLIVCMPFMPLILQAIVTVFSFIFKGLWWIITAPFKWIYKKIRKE